MIAEEKTMSVPQAASLCGVTRTTVNHWIKTKKLHADRSGRNYSVPVKDLFLFLKSTERTIPFELESDHWVPVFKTYRRCWDYWKGTGHGDGCNDCVVLKNQLKVCFTAKNSIRVHCSTSCNECSYYQDICLPRIQFIHQFELPAAVCQGLFFWGVNRKWSKICQMPLKHFPGTGIERIIDQDSLEAVISLIKKLRVEEHVQPINRVYFKKGIKDKLEVILSFFPLNEPRGTFLMLAEPQGLITKYEQFKLGQNTAKEV
ncbi:MAG: helix-turn-helix domain-containing protein [Thermodesulfobacteriota bacterium]|nr:helix-turn-helix domain-containing protein [Thermodesulfobacteriota bacterium]